jgi:hypothetical protein
MNTSNLVIKPRFQTCELWQDGCLKGFSTKTPLPILDKQIYGEKMAIQLNGGDEIHRDYSEVRQINRNGTMYVWYNPDDILRSLMTVNCFCNAGSYMRKFPDGSYEARLCGNHYVWGPPCLASTINRPSRKIDFIEVCGELLRDIDLDYTLPHESSCLCLECAESPVKPVFHHSQLCQCERCRGQVSDDDDR